MGHHICGLSGASSGQNRKKVTVSAKLICCLSSQNDQIWRWNAAQKPDSGAL